jgi:hypothetical protein
MNLDRYMLIYIADAMNLVQGYKCIYFRMELILFTPFCILIIVDDDFLKYV